MKQFGVSLLVLLGLAGTALIPASKADPVYKTTEVTFSAPVEIPGMVLPPGTYVMKLLDPFLERNVVRFYNAKENHMYAMVFTVPAYRVTPVDHTVITFEERAQNAPEAIHEWFPPWENWGTEFVYPKPTLAAAVVPPAPQPPAAVVAPTAAPAPAPKPVETPAPTAQVEPTPPVEIAQAQPAPAPAATAPAPAAPQELPKTASNVPAVALFGGLLLLAGVVLRRRIS